MTMGHAFTAESQVSLGWYNIKLQVSLDWHQYIMNE